MAVLKTEMLDEGSSEAEKSLLIRMLTGPEISVSHA